MNRNLHNTTKLTEFARDFDDEPDSLLGKFVVKLTNAYNTGYNTVNVAPSNSTIPSQSQQSTTYDENSTATSSTQNERHISIDQENSEQLSSDNLSTTSVPMSDEQHQQSEALSGRTPKGVIERISKLVAFGNNNLTHYKDTELQKFWMPDSKSKECYECAAKFSTFRRKHHCRLCGQIFCAKCCNQVIPGKIIKCSGDLKVCTYCSKIVLGYLKSSDINADLKSDLQALQEDLTNKFSGDSDPISIANSFVTSDLHRKVSVGYQEERFVSTASSSLSNTDRRNILQQSNSLKFVHDELLRDLPYQNSGTDLVNYLISHRKSANKSQASAILCAMIEAGFLVPQHLSPTENLNEFYETTTYKLMRIDDVMTHSGSYQLDLNLEASSVHLTKPLGPHGESDPGSINLESGAIGNVILSNDDFETNSVLSTAGSRPLMQAFCDHEELLLGQLLQSASLDLNWSKTLIPLCARIANSMRPDICSDLIDIRHFVNFKKVPGGIRNECRIFGGVVCSKNVVHRDMATEIEKPRILLLQCAIVYQRIEGKFVSIETVLLQEKEYLHNVIERIVSLKPNVVVVHKNVAGIAQDMLRSRGITLVIDVKLSVMERLARCFKCDIVTSIDSNIGRPQLGTCNKFYVKTFMNEDGAKTLMFFESPSSTKGCCAILRGGTFNELSRLKKVCRLLLFARYNWRLELAFLLDSFAEPPAPKTGIFDSKEHSPCGNRETDISNQPEKNIFRTDRINSTEEKLLDMKREKIYKENVPDYSDPLRAMKSEDVIPDSSGIQFAVEAPFDNRFRTSLSSLVLSISPYLSFPLPYLETEQGRKCALRKHFPNELFYSKQWSEGPQRQSSIDQKPKKKDSFELKPPHPFLTYKLTPTPSSMLEYQNLLADFRASGCRYPKTMTMKIISKNAEIANDKNRIKPSKEEMIYKDALAFENHQRLPVLFCSYYYNVKAPSAFCAQPSVLNMEFYGKNDIMLGQFLENYCFRASYICSSCNLPMLDHRRRYVHSMGCVEVTLSLDQTKNDLNSILMTSGCNICKYSSPGVSMSQDTWCFSFAKYLEHRFHGHIFKKRMVDKQAIDSNIDSNNSFADTDMKCNHSIHRDHFQYFCYKGIMACFKYYPIEVWEIRLPPLILKLGKSNLNDISAIADEFKSFRTQGYDIYAKIFDTLAQKSTDIESPALSNLKLLANKDQYEFRRQVENVQEILNNEIVDKYGFNDAKFLMKRTLAESIETWENRLSDAVSNNRSSQSSNTRSEPNQVDSGTVCTEDLRAESPMVNRSSEDELEGASTTTQLDGKSALAKRGSSDNILDKPSSETNKDGDKKSMKTLLRELLPSSATISILPNPFSSQDHYTLPVGLLPILIKDTDLSSIISYSLMNTEYKRYLEQSYANNTESSNSPYIKRKSQDIDRESDEKDSNTKESKESKKEKCTYAEVSFQDQTTNFSCKIYFPREFDLLRLNCLNTSLKNNENFYRAPSQSAGNSDNVEKKSSSSNLGSTSKTESLFTPETDSVRLAFARSLSSSVAWDAKGGKSGSKFNKTTDDRFILKEMSKQDVAIFENFAPNYFEYMNQCLLQNQPTLLVKIFGVFKVTIKKKDYVVEKAFLVLENLFYGLEICNKFDLKGSERNRKVEIANQTGEIVLMDENFIQMSWSQPLYILSHSRSILREAILRDASFLEKNEVMDYSLLVGLNEKDRTLVVGIIDYIRTYTLDKKIESLVKQTGGLLGGQAKLPTVISPKSYKQRFSEAMERYFLIVPDRWEGLTKNC